MQRAWIYFLTVKKKKKKKIKIVKKFKIVQIKNLNQLFQSQF